MAKNTASQFAASQGVSRRSRPKAVSLSPRPEDFFNSLPIALIGVDAKGKISFWQPGRQEALAVPVDAVVGEPLERVLKELADRHRAPALEGLYPLIGAALRGGKEPSGWQFEFFRGNKRFVLQADFASLNSINGENGAGGTLMLRDVTDLTRLEDNTHEVGHMVAMGQIAACMAHEVRNPLSTVKAAAQLIMEEHAGNGTISHYAEVINREAGRLERLVGDFLRYARPEELQSAPVSLAELLQRGRDLLEQEAQAREVVLECRLEGEPAYLQGDFDALLQVLLNLGKNALEATPPQGKVSITALCGKSRKSPIVLEVSDEGAGIPRKHMAKIFEPFFSTKPQGTGLGLGIAKKLTEAHGASLEITRHPGKGTCVRISFPQGK